MLKVYKSVCSIQFTILQIGPISDFEIVIFTPKVLVIKDVCFYFTIVEQSKQVTAAPLPLEEFELIPL